MPVPRLSMSENQARCLRSQADRGLSHRAVAHACAIGVGTVTLYLQRATDCGVGWPVPTSSWTIRRWSRHGCLPRAAPVGDCRITCPQCAEIHRDGSSASGSRCSILWLGRMPRSHPDGYRYSQFMRSYLPALGSAPPAVDASGASGRREDLHRLLG